MSKNKDKKMANRARKAARDEEQGKKVVNIIFGGLVALAVVFLLYYTIMMS